MKGNNSIAKLAFKAPRISASLADIRQESVLFGDAVEQDGTLFAKSIQEGRSRFASKLGLLEAVPDSKIYETRHDEIGHLVDVRETTTYSSSGNSGKIVVEVVIRHSLCSCTLPEDGDLSWSVIKAMAGGRRGTNLPCRGLHQMMRCSPAPTAEQHVDHAGRG